MGYLLPFLCIAGGILAASSLILAKKPDAKELIGKIQPYQAFIGAALLGIGIYNFFIYIGPSMMFHVLGLAPLLGITLWGMLVTAILLGILFGMPMIAKMSAGGAAKGEELGKKMAPFQALIGIVAIGSGLLGVLYQFGILKPF